MSLLIYLVGLEQNIDYFLTGASTGTIMNIIIMSSILKIPSLFQYRDKYYFSIFLFNIFSFLLIHEIATCFISCGTEYKIALFLYYFKNLDINRVSKYMVILKNENISELDLIYLINTVDYLNNSSLLYRMCFSAIADEFILLCKENKKA